MLALTPSERRGALVLVLLLALGAAHDLWRAWRPPAAPDLAPSLGLGVSPGPAPGASIDAAREEQAAASRMPPDVARPGASAGPGPGGAIDLNRAGARELDALPGVGPVLAERILLQRLRYGPFRGLEDLLAVRGVGPRLLDRIRPWAVVSPPDAPAAPAGPPPDSLANARP